jgi:hypothetical protein
MALPDEFRKEAESLQFTGFGGHNRGRWQLGTYQGEFTRRESRLGIADPLLVSSKGKSSFTFASSEEHEPLTAVCKMQKRSVTIGIVTLDPKKMHYDCEFRRAGILTGDRFYLGRPKPANMKERLLANETRVGEAIIDGLHLTIKSVHKYDDSAFSSQAPIGYLFSSADATAGAVELTDWNPAVYISEDLIPSARESVLITALAIAVLRDPADSALED